MRKSARSVSRGGAPGRTHAEAAVAEPPGKLGPVARVWARQSTRTKSLPIPCILVNDSMAFSSETSRRGRLTSPRRFSILGNEHCTSNDALLPRGGDRAESPCFLVKRSNSSWKRRAASASTVTWPAPCPSGAAPSFKNSSPKSASRGGQTREASRKAARGRADLHRGAAAPSPAEAGPEDIPLSVLRGPWLLAVDKPRGLVVHPAPGHSGGTLVNALLHLGAGIPISSGVGGVLRPGIVHRLDKDTSGVLWSPRTTSPTGRSRSSSSDGRWKRCTWPWCSAV